jgi:predicted transcriptional regulator
VKLNQIIEQLNLKIRSGTGSLDREVTGGYVSDLLSDVIANGKEGNLWITLQTHENIVAVAIMNKLAGVLIINDREPENETRERAEEEDVPILVTGQSSFEIAGRLFELLRESSGDD